MTTAASVSEQVGRVGPRAWWRSLHVDERRGLIVLLVVNPGVTTYYLSVSWPSGPHVMLVGAVLLLWGGRRFGHSPELGATLRLLATSFGILFLLNPLWFLGTSLYVQATGFHRDVFRLVMPSAPQLPVYGWPHAVESAVGAILALPLVLGAVYWLVARGDEALDHRSTRRLVVIAYAALVAAFALTTSVDRLVGPVNHFRNFFEDSRRFASTSELLATYVGRLSTLSFRTAHYPPGYLWLFVVERQTGLVGLTKLLNYACSAGALALAYRLARRIGLAERDATFGLALAASSAGMLIFPSTAPEGYVCFAALLAIERLHVAMEQRSLARGAVGGLALAALTLISFSASFVGVLVALMAVLGIAFRAYRLRDVVLATSAALPVYVAVFVALRLLAGFDIVACLRQSVANNVAGMSPAFDSLPRYLMRSTGNLLGYLGSVGPAVVAFAVGAAVALRKLTAPQCTLVAATTLTLVGAAFSGLHFMETERIWLYFTPLLAVGGACAMQRTGRSLAVAWSLLFAGVFEVGFQHYR